LKSLHGRKIAVDASMAIYQFLIAVRSGGPNQQAQMLTNADGETTSHIQGMFNRTIRFMTEGIKPAFVFDGKAPNMKSGELEKRREKRRKAEEELKKAEDDGNVEEIDKHSKRLARAGKKENDDCKKLLQLMGVPVIIAPMEAEAECSALCKAGLVWATGTEDMDALTFQTPILIRKLTFANQSAKGANIQQIDYKKAIEGLNLTYDQFVDLCIMLGCDYCDSIKGIGPKTA
jgi:flap endonuclease-1